MATLTSTARTGSPPHTRGKAVLTAFERRFPGITPAHAGKRRSSGCSTPRWWDHPRTRGEKLTRVQKSLWSTGSPPHTRGKGQPEGPGAHRQGITPAHAGKSRGWPRGWGYTQDHPRTRGEKLSPITGGAMWTGSPPHTRGKGIPTMDKKRGKRITPAHAGKRLNGSRF